MKPLVFMGGGTGTGQMVQDAIHGDLIRRGYLEVTNFYTVEWQGSSNPSERDNTKNLTNMIEALQQLNKGIKDEDLVVIPASLVPSSQAYGFQAPYAVYISSASCS